MKTESKEELKYRFCTNATENGKTVRVENDCSQNTLDYIMLYPLYNKWWFEIKGGIFGEEWANISDIIIGDNVYQES